MLASQRSGPDTAHRTRGHIARVHSSAQRADRRVVGAGDEFARAICAVAAWPVSVLRRPTGRSGASTCGWALTVARVRPSSTDRLAAAVLGWENRIAPRHSRVRASRRPRYRTVNSRPMPLVGGDGTAPPRRCSLPRNSFKAAPGNRLALLSATAQAEASRPGWGGSLRHLRLFGRWLDTQGMARRLSALRMVPAANPGGSAALAALILAGGVLPVAFAVGIGHLTSTAVHAKRVGQLLPELVWVGGAFLLQQAVGPVQVALSNVMGRDLDLLARSRVLAAVGAPVGIADLEDPEVLDKIKVAQGLSVWSASPYRAVTGFAA